jgi:hypothetical protein
LYRYTLETTCVDLSRQLADAHDALLEARRRADAAESREASSRVTDREDDRRRVAAAAVHAENAAGVREELASAKAHLATMRDRDGAYLVLRDEVGLALFTLVCSQNTVQLMTATQPVWSMYKSI